MLSSKFLRHLIAFNSIALASILLYPVAQENNTLLIWILLAVITIAAILTVTK